MKKLLAVLSIVGMGMTLAACGSEISSTPASSSAPATSVSSEEEKSYGIALDVAHKAVKDAGDKNCETKRELHDRYGMKSPYGSQLGEWYEQADAYQTYAKGKTPAELASADYKTHYTPKGTVEVSGCTITMSGFAEAMTATTNYTKKSVTLEAGTYKLGLGTIVNPFSNDDGYISVSLGATLSKEGKVTAAEVNDYQVPCTLNDGVVTLDTSKKQASAANIATNGACSETAVLSKAELGDLYGMKVSYGSQLGEWYEQANAYEAYAVGKTGAELTGANYKTHYTPKGTVEVSGCTITMSGFAASIAEGMTLAQETTLAAGTYTFASGSLCEWTAEEGDTKAMATIIGVSLLLDSEGKVAASYIDELQAQLVKVEL